MTDMLRIDWHPLLMAAQEVRQRAWCPYSRFAVGAAVLTGSGRIIAGCNVENASYGLSICAERSALVRCIAEGEREIRAIAICAEPLAWPCGACRQFIVEFGLEIEIQSFSPNAIAEARQSRIDQLLPHAFRFQPPG